MSLFKCYECGREVSTQAAACPGCGCPVLTKIQNAVTPPALPAVAPPLIPAAPALILERKRKPVSLILVGCLCAGGILLFILVGIIAIGPLDSGAPNTQAGSPDIGEQYSLSNDSRHPDQSEVAKAVNWSLGQKIKQTQPNENLYESYQIVNRYQEGDGFVYDYTAKCMAVEAVAIEGTGGRPFLSQYFGNVERKTFSLTGSVTLVKKGDRWYYSNTIR